MKRSTRPQWPKVLGVIAVLILIAAPKLWRTLNRKGRATHLFDRFVERIDHTIGWHRLPTWLSVISLIRIRHTLRQQNLYSTDTPGIPEPAPPPSPRHATVRTPDGTYNDLEHPAMGSAGTRFGRNVPLTDVYPAPLDELLSPSPRTVSLELMTRHTFQPATTLNILAAAWLQFMIRDWLSHGTSDKENPWLVPLAADDPWHENPMRILRTAADPTRSAADAVLPPTHVNFETHWWDASQLYGSNIEFQQQVRSGIDGKVRLEESNMVTGKMAFHQFEVAGWWVGLGLMFTLFALEHNAICDRLKAEYGAWDDELLFQHARLINAALLAKIHTVEWTTAILGHPALQIGMRANWWGIAGERLHKLVGRLSRSEVLNGIPGSNTQHFGVPYSITEEFVAVYRMHPLIPDDYELRSARTDELLQRRTFPELAGQHAVEVMEQVGMADLLYSFGIAHPGAVTLHNFPRGLQHFERPDGVVIDLAAHDILRTRELGVPRYNQFRQHMHLPRVTTFEELTDNPIWAEEIRRVYQGDIEQVDVMTGLYAERLPEGFGFSDTAFRIFALMASRRLNSDRFFTTDFTPEVYTPVGMQWLDENTMSTVLLRHFPELAPTLHNVQNAFAPWPRRIAL